MVSPLIVSNINNPHSSLFRTPRITIANPAVTRTNWTVINQLRAYSLQLESPPPHGQLAVLRVQVPVPGLEKMAETDS